MTGTPAALAITLSSMLVTGLLGLLGLYALRRRSIAPVLTATVLVPVASLAVGVAVVTTLVPPGRLDRLVLPIAVAVVVSAGLAIGISKIIMKASVGLRRAVELHDDTAVIFRALADPMSRTLIRHLAEAGECDGGVGRQLLMDRRAVALRLDRLTAAGLIRQAQSADGTQLYRLSDAAEIERLLASVRQLWTRR